MPRLRPAPAPHRDADGATDTKITAANRGAAIALAHVYRDFPITPRLALCSPVASRLRGGSALCRRALVRRDAAS
jgi:hypothetical protein